MHSTVHSLQILRGFAMRFVRDTTMALPECLTGIFNTASTASSPVRFTPETEPLQVRAACQTCSFPSVCVCVVMCCDVL